MDASMIIGLSLTIGTAICGVLYYLFKEVYMYDVFDIVRAVISIVLCIALISLAVFTITNVLLPIIQVSDAEDSIYAGTIIDKEIINAHSGLFSSSEMDYQLVIQGTFEYYDQTVTGEKSISVDKETYLQANIGDWFDSHTLEITNKE